MSESMDVVGVAFVFGIFTLVTFIIVVVIWQFASNYRARVLVAREEAYRKLAEQAIATQAEMAEALAEIRPRVAAMEKLMREVE